MAAAALGEVFHTDSTSGRDRQLLSLYIKCTKRDAPVTSRHTKVWPNNIQHGLETTSRAIANTDKWWERVNVLRYREYFRGSNRPVMSC
jgi:hypothetical protein